MQTRVHTSNIYYTNTYEYLLVQPPTQDRLVTSFDFHRTLLRLLDPIKSAELAGAPPASPTVSQYQPVARSVGSLGRVHHPMKGGLVIT